MAYYVDEHLKTFAKSLKKEIEKYGIDDKKKYLNRQKWQIETLVKLENDFRKELLKHRWGLGIYKDFVVQICDKRRNILAARPYFRERQPIFTSKISKALRKREHKKIIKYHFNFQFIQFTMKQRKWGRQSNLYKIYEQIKEVRTELIEMNMPLAINRTKLFWSRVPPSQLSYMDFVQIASMGLMSAIDKFCLPYSKVFRSVAIGRIVGNFIADYCVDNNLTLITSDNQRKMIKDFVPGDKILGVDNEGNTIETEVVALHDHGILEGYEVTFDDGYQIICSEKHKFLTSHGMCAIKEIVNKNLEVFCEPTEQARWMESELRDSVPLKEEAVRSHAELRSVSKTDLREETELSQDSGLSEHIVDWVDLSLRGALSETKANVRPQGDLYSLQGGSQGPAQSQHYQMEGRESRSSYGKHGPSKGSSGSTQEVRSDLRQGMPSEYQGWAGEVENQQRGSVRDQYEKSPLVSEAFQNGSMAQEQQNLDLGRRTSSLRERTEASRLHFSKRQDLDRSGRSVPFYRSVKESSPSSASSVQGCNVESGSSKSRRRDVDSVGSGLLHLKHRGDEAGLVGMAYSTAPLASSGSLVCRKVVRYRPVGQRGMSDLEVAHPKHNFLLPNGIVTSNSETLVHFFPADKRKIYRANKVVRRFKDGTIDFEKLTAEINRSASREHKTTPSEIADLMSAASLISTEGGSEEEVKNGGILGNCQASANWQPDVRAELNSSLDSLGAAIGKLTLLEQKLLSLRGVDLNDQ